MEARAQVVDAAVTSASRLFVQLAPSPDWDADELTDFTVLPEPYNGGFWLHLSRPGPIGGTFNLNYLTSS